ncbi:MAG: response regulator, partial [Lachnospiraceae bacterium]|nr:response regulator [Lachnospiraceae bacterium]
IVIRILYVLIKRIRTTSKIYRNKYAVILFLFLFVIVLDGIIVLFRNPLNISIMFYGVLAIAISYYTIYFQPQKLIIDMQTIMLNNLKNGILFFDDKQNCIYANDTLCKMIGVKNDLDKVEKIVKEKSNADNIHDQEYTTWYEDIEINGELKNYKVECHNIYDERNIYVGCCINVSDNTQLKKYYEMEVNIAKNASKAKTDFLSRVSHDIRTPINSISGMNEMILRECKDKKIMEYAYQISESAEMLLNLINNVLDFTKIEAGKMTLVNREYDTRKMLEGIVDIISIQASKKKIDFVYHISSDLPAKLYGDDVRISQIIMNLLSNAIKYTSEGSVTLTVKKVHDGEGSAEIFVSVKDTGMGIKEEDLSKLFNAFERFEEVKNHSIQGSGLGLNIVSYFLQMMNSNLEVDSEYGKGSDFSFVITQTIVDETPIETFDSKVQNNENYEYQALFTAPDAKILVVDDNEINRFVFVSLLSATKVQVDEAESGIKCLEMTKKEKYHMIFMDHMMPEMDGIETFHKIKEDENNLCRDIPIVALTANAIEGARQMYLDEGFNAYLAKPFDPEEVETLIRDSLPKELIL